MKKLWKNYLTNSTKLYQSFFLIATLFAVLSCGGTRQTEIEKHENITIENEYKEGFKIVLGNTFTYTPFDALKPMKIEGKEYVNAIVKSDKSKTITKWKDRNITKTIVVEKTKQTTRQDNTWLYVGLFAVLVIGVLAWFKLPKIKPSL